MGRAAVWGSICAGVLVLGGSALWLGLAPASTPESSLAASVSADAGAVVLVCPPGVVDPDLLLGAATLAETSGAAETWAEGESVELEGGGVAYEVDGATETAAMISEAAETEGDLLSFDLQTCQTPRTSFGFAAGSTAVGENAVLVLSNPSEKSADAVIRALDSDGLDASANVTVPALSTVYVVPATWAYGSSSLGITVDTDGAGLAGWLQSSGLEGEVSTGLTRVQAQQASRDLVFPGVAEGLRGSLRIVNSGQEAAEVTLSVMGAGGSSPLSGFESATVLPGRTLEVDVSSLPAGTSSLRVQADKPVIADVVLTSVGEAHEEVTGQSYSSRSAVSPTISVTQVDVTELQAIIDSAEELGFTDPQIRLYVANPAEDAVSFEVQGQAESLDAGASQSYQLEGASEAPLLVAEAGVNASLLASVQTPVGVVDTFVPLGAEGTAAQSRLVQLVPSR